MTAEHTHDTDNMSAVEMAALLAFGLMIAWGARLIVDALVDHDERIEDVAARLQRIETGSIVGGE